MISIPLNLLNIKKRKVFICFSSIFIFFLLIFIYVKARKNYLCKGCNIILIDIDGLRADGLSCYGYRYDTTPALCSLSNSGILFKNNFTSSSWTLPGMASTITSVYPFVHNTRFAYQKSSYDGKTMAEYFNENGYSTFLFGPTYETSYTPPCLTKGFDNVIEETDPGRILDKIVFSDRPFYIHIYDENLHIPYLLTNGTAPLYYLEKPVGFLQTEAEYNNALKEHLRTNYKEVFTAKAFELYPDLFTDIDSAKATKIMQLFKLAQDKDGLINEKYPIVKKVYRNYSEDGLDVNYLRLMYDTKLRSEDNKFIKLIELLKSKGLYDRTVIVLLSEHGEYFGEHGLFAHPNSLYDEVIHTPLIFYIPKTKKVIKSEISENIDIFPTLTRIVGLEEPKNIQGNVLINKFLPDIFYRFFSYAISDTNSGNSWSIRTNVWKLIVDEIDSRTPYYKLVNIVSDPKEEENLADIFPEIKKYFSNKIVKIRRDSINYINQNKGNNFQNWVDDKTRQRLIEEGYF